MTSLNLRACADLGKIVGRDDATAYRHVLDKCSAWIDAQHVGSLMGASKMEVPVVTSINKPFLVEDISPLAGKKRWCRQP